MICRPVQVQPTQTGCCPPQLPPRRRNRKRRIRAQRGMGGRSVDPFLHCIYGPVNYVGEGSRAPDGNTEPSVVIEHRAVYTVTASDDGNITMALVPSPYGCVAVDEGTVVATINTASVASGTAPFPYTAPASTSIPFTTQSWNPSSGIAHHYQLLPYLESIRQAGQVIGDSNQYGLMQSKFRVLSTQAKISYIGNDFNNQGVAATARLAFDLDSNFPMQPPTGLTDDAYFCSYGAPVPQILPDSMSSVASLPGARVFPVSQSIHMINAPQRFDYQPVKEGWIPFLGGPHGDYSLGTTGGVDRVFGGIMNNELTTGPVTSELVGSDGIGGIGHAPITLYAATGLALVAANPLSILVEARCCIEYTLAYNSPAARFASLPPPERPLAIKAAHNFGRLLPSSVPSTPSMEEHGWFSRFMEWYWPKEKAAATASMRLGAGLAGRLAGLQIGNSLGGNYIQGGGRQQLAIGY